MTGTVETKQVELDAIKKKQGVKLRNEDKLSRIPIKVVPLDEPLKKPSWIKVKLPTGENFNRVKSL